MLLEHGALSLTYFPDGGTSLIQRTPEVQIVLTAMNASYLVEGSDLLHLSRAREILSPGKPGSFDNGYAGVSAVIRLGETLYGFYHAEDHEKLPVLPGNIPGFYASIGLATSDDKGVSWQKRGQVITSHQPKSWESYPNQGDRGAAEPGAVLSTDGRYLYLYYTEHSRVGGRGVDICLARADLRSGPPLPGTFSKYRDGAFSEPGLGGNDTPILTSGTPSANTLEGHVTYSKQLKKYLMVLGIDAWEERTAGRPPSTSGIYLSSSDDGVRWATPTRLVADQAVPQTGHSLSWEASLLWDDDDGKAGWLVYGYTPSWGTTPHYLVGRRLDLVGP